MKLSEIYRGAADALKEKQWLQGRLAADAIGRSVHPCDEAVTCLCFEGAVYRACHKREDRQAALRFGTSIIGRSLSGWNDDPLRTKADVVAMARALAIAAERAGQ